MNGIKEKDKREKSYAGTTKFALILRVIAAVYLLYMTVTILRGYMDGDGLPFYLLVTTMVVFTGFGVFVTVKALKALVKGEYSGGKADKCGKEKEEPSESKSTAKRVQAKNNVLLSDRLKKYNEQGAQNGTDDSDKD